MFSQKNICIEAPEFYNSQSMNKLTKKQLVEHALKLTEYAEKLEANRATWSKYHA